MKLPRRSLLLGTIAGCTAPAAPPGTVAIAPGVVLRLPGADELGRSIEVAQMVRGQYHGQEFTFEGQLSVSRERMLLACIDPLGRPGLTARWDHGRLSAQVTAPFPTALRADNMLADIMLIYWPAPSLQRGLAGGSVTEGGHRRTVRNAQQPMIEIDYPSTDPWNGSVRYNNFLWGYTLEINSVEVLA